ncbi:glycosyltransferase, partial [Metallibacterium scheffleri]
VGQMQDNGTALKPWRHLFRHVTHVPRAQLADLFRKADAFAFPTIIEGRGLGGNEAIACGLPVLTTWKGHGDCVRDGVYGDIVPPREVGVLLSCWMIASR